MSGRGDTSGPSERQVGDEEFLDIAGSQAEARLLRKALQQLSDGGAGQALQEMAREVLSGRMGLREAVSQGAYGGELIDKTESFRRDWESMSDREREELAEHGRQLIDEERREIEAERREADSGRSGRHSGRGWSAY
ncbi:MULTISPECIES: hypothetical protein [unclassified Streptomyces]|uniref:hypothetical protein n=1 Tax=unclassified Streptomyces TaxID=2593676 RepID=UPI0004C00523|nr:MULTISPECIES: hypothetical protein [unclassified Streptomyces]